MTRVSTLFGKKLANNGVLVETESCQHSYVVWYNALTKKHYIRIGNDEVASITRRQALNIAKGIIDTVKYSDESKQGSTTDYN